MELAGIAIDDVTMAEVLIKLEEFIAKGWPHLIVTPNPEMIVNAQEDEELRNILNHAQLHLPDGISMVVVSRILGKPLRERVTGIDFMLQAAKLSAQKGYKIFLLGGTKGVAEAAGKKLQEKYPGLKVVGTNDGYFKDDRELTNRIRFTHPDIVFAGLGMGRQEKWLAANLQELNVPVSIGVGGSMDVISGMKKRAPRLFQALYIEWLYRLITEPQRWKRQLALPKFLWLTLVKPLAAFFR